MFIPGRIEVLGKHTDYCGGRSIVCAIDRGFHAEVEPRIDTLVVLQNRDSGETISIDLTDPKAVPRHWANYAVEVARRVKMNFISRSLTGVTIRLRSDLPKAAGLSSSSALMIMVFNALSSVNGLPDTDEYRANIRDDLALAEYLGCIENGQSFRELAGSTGVGTFGGSQDHAAIMLGRSGYLSEFSFAPLAHLADVAFPSDYVFVVASSGVSANKTGAARPRFNRMSSMVSEITAAAGGTGSLAKTIDKMGIDEVRSLIVKREFSFTTKELLDRLEHFYVENFEIIPAVSALLAAGKIDDIGDLVDLSQQNTERLLGNQIDETIFLQRSAREIGSVAASAFGAGFGGSVYAITRASEADDLIEEWRRVYLTQYPQHRATSEFFATTLVQAMN